VPLPAVVELAAVPDPVWSRTVDDEDTTTTVAIPAPTAVNTTKPIPRRARGLRRMTGRLWCSVIAVAERPVSIAERGTNYVDAGPDSRPRGESAIFHLVGVSLPPGDRNLRMRESCICGAAIWVLGGDEDCDAEVMTLWQSQHLGAGHGLCTPHRARHIRDYRSRRIAEGLPVGVRKNGHWGQRKKVGAAT